MSQLGKPPCDEGAILHGAEAAPCAKARRRWTLAAAILGSSMAFVDGTVANVALPAIQRALGASAAEAQWVIEAYALFLAALLLAGGALGDRFGRKRMFLAGTALFTAASLACGLASSVAALIAARAVQGVGAALLVPGSLALISATFPKQERGGAIGTWSAFSGVAAAVGPVLGGFLIDHASWHWAFLVNVPVGVALIAITAVRVPESRGDAARAPLDLAGAALATLGLAGVVFALIEAPARGARSAAVLGAGAAGLAALAAFVAVERRRREPMLPPRLFAHRAFSGANLLTLLLYAALGGGLYYLPLVLIQVQGTSATAAGAALLPFVALMFLLSPAAGRWVDRHGPRGALIAGPAVAALGFALFALPGADAGYWRGIFPAVCVLGLGMTITVAPLTTTVMNAVGEGQAGLASGVNNAVSRVGPLLALAAFGVLMAVVFEHALQARLAALQAPPAVVEAMLAERGKLAALPLPPGLDAASAAALKGAVGGAFVAGFRWVMAVCAGLALLSAASAWFLIDAPRRIGPLSRSAGEG